MQFILSVLMTKLLVGLCGMASPCISEASLGGITSFMVIVLCFYFDLVLAQSRKDAKRRDC
jgi:hypothetical protein